MKEERNDSEERMTLGEAVILFCDLCEHYEISFCLRRETGRYISAEDFIKDGRMLDVDDLPPEVIKQGPVGYTIKVGGLTLASKSGEKQMYPDLESAIVAGFSLLEKAKKRKDQRDHDKAISDDILG